MSCHQNRADGRAGGERRIITASETYIKIKESESCKKKKKEIKDTLA